MTIEVSLRPQANEDIKLWYRPINGQSKGSWQIAREKSHTQSGKFEVVATKLEDPNQDNLSGMFIYSYLKNQGGTANGTRIAKGSNKTFDAYPEILVKGS